MRIVLKSALIVAVSALVIPACFARKSNTPQKLPAQSFPDYIDAKLAFGVYHQAWALMSSSGYENQGQLFIFELNNKKDIDIEVVKAGERKVSHTYRTTHKDSPTLAPLLQRASKLKPFESKVFDGVTYEFRHYQKADGSTFNLVKSLEMNNPEAMGAKEHVEIIKSLEAFRVHPSSKKER